MSPIVRRTFNFSHLFPVHVGVLPSMPLAVEDGRAGVVEDPQVVQHHGIEDAALFYGSGSVCHGYVNPDKGRHVSVSALLTPGVVGGGVDARTNGPLENVNIKW